jgi:hypothetical protein
MQVHHPVETAGFFYFVPFQVHEYSPNSVWHMAKNDLPGAPDSVLLGIKTLRRCAGFKNRRQLAAAVKKRQPRGRMGISERSWENIELGEVELIYWHLEALERVTGTPTGVILISTHVMSLLRDCKFADVQKFSNGLKALADLIQLHAQTGNKSRLDKKQQSDFLEILFRAWKKSGFIAASKHTKNPSV